MSRLIISILQISLQLNITAMFRFKLGNLSLRLAYITFIVGHNRHG